MPTYEYECRECGHTFEKFQSMTEERIKTCPECKGQVDRLIGTGAGIIFKGSGFYQTDYRSDAYQQSARKDTTAATSAKTETKKESGTKSDSGSSGSEKKAAKAGKGTSDA